ncbi:hypothetical protein IJT93_05665 [bacterium]|nr:hypothetical protein [bacterium]
MLNNDRNADRIKPALIAAAFLFVIIFTELILMADSAQKEKEIALTTLAGFAVTPTENVSPFSDWIGLKRAQKIMKEERNYTLPPDKQKNLRAIEEQTLRELSAAERIYAEIYGELSENQLKFINEPNKYIAAYYSAGSEGSDKRSYNRSVCTLKKRASLKPFSAAGFADAESAVFQTKDRSKEKIYLSPDLCLLLTPVNRTPLPPAVPEGAGTQRQAAVKKLQEAKVYPLKLLLCLGELAFREDRDCLTPEQAQRILILLGRLKLVTLRIQECHYSATLLFPGSFFRELEKAQENWPSEIRRLEYLISPRTLNNIRTVFEDENCALLQRPEKNAKIFEANRSQRY